MDIDREAIRRRLKDSDFRALFIEELGWDTFRETVSILVEDASYTLTGIAHKRGLPVYLCPSPDGDMPDYNRRGRIERELAKQRYEHLIVFTDTARTSQVWQWVKREPGRPTARREHHFDGSQSGEALIQKLVPLAIALEEEERIDLVDVTGRVAAGFDVEGITKKFYERFKTEHAAFLSFVQGITDQADQEWYASVMLNRLMFVWFIQKKGFLDHNHDYLRTKLRETQDHHGKGQFQTFYRHFLRRLFHEGLGTRRESRSVEMDALLGDIPYLNGGLFDEHDIERRNPTIEVPDEAFEKLFAFFDTYQWHLDDRPVRAGDEINPDVLGYIFEKYINQKQMGAYYTKEDITGYITQNTIIPLLLDRARQGCRVAFEGNTSVWQLLQSDPDRYIHASMQKGTELSLPPDIATGVDDVSRRGGWNQRTPEEYALPTEIWRETLARRRQYEETRAKLVAGEVQSANDLITLNLDGRRFAQDVITYAEGSDLLRSIWRALERVTVLDPTCGSGAFLFAAMNVLAPLYEACLDRMEAFVEEADNADAPPTRYADFRAVLARLDLHPNHEHFILKSIAVNNLYGVDIMEEAVEICKLRLFLKLMAQIKDPKQIEPLPDIDFNIRAGNTLVGYATLDAVRQGLTFKTGGSVSSTASGQSAQQARAPLFGEDDRLRAIEEKAHVLDIAVAQFQAQQTELPIVATPEEKRIVQTQLDNLRNELDRGLAIEYGINPNDLSR